MNKQTVLQSIIDKLKVDLGVAQRAAHQRLPDIQQLARLTLISLLATITNKVKITIKINLTASFL
jgi:hypothetical protein